MNKDIKKYIVDADDGQVMITVSRGAVGGWMSASQVVGTPLTHHQIRPVTWVEDIRQLVER